MSMFRAGAALAVAFGFLSVATPAWAVPFNPVFTAASIPTEGGGQCGPDGGIQVDWDGLGFDTGTPTGDVHLNALAIGMSSQTGSFGGLVKPATGNTLQSAVISLGSGSGATFFSGNHFYTNILSMTLTSNGAVSFKGTQLDKNQLFTLTIDLAGGKSLVFNLTSIQGSSITFDHNGVLTDLNLRFCGTLAPVVPEPSCLFLLGSGALAAASTLRRKIRR